MQHKTLDMIAMLFDQKWSLRVYTYVAPKDNSGQAYGFVISAQKRFQKNWNKAEFYVKSFKEFPNVCEQILDLNTQIENGKNINISIGEPTYEPVFSRFSNSSHLLEQTNSAEKIVEIMLGLGWRFEFTLQTKREHRKENYHHISFSKWVWHGKMTGHDVKFYTIKNFPDDNYVESVRQVALMSLKAWNDFPDSIPHINASGKIVTNKLATSLMFDQK